ncbi:4Fe-4S dicluster domain-containing protein [Candidatus Sumerlaeota bacterium]|nr:4Fe-4S dicluster domain-containing protein [Candidatus Sumerlaeota bacterium]
MGKVEKVQTEECVEFTPVTIKQDLCKGCGLCVEVCPRHLIAIDKTRINKKGYHPARYDDPENACLCCANCALVCPDVAIEIVCEIKDKE